MLKDSTLTLQSILAHKAEDLYRSREYLCADAILLAFNDAFDGGLTEQQIVGLTSGMSMGQGESGCLCGAVGGGALVLGLFLGQDGAHRNSAKVRTAVNELHQRFRFAHKSTCCRVLTSKVKNDEAAHFEQCARYTGEAAGMVADILLDRRAELAELLDVDFASSRHHAGISLIRRAFNKIFR